MITLIDIPAELGGRIKIEMPDEYTKEDLDKVHKFWTNTIQNICTVYKPLTSKAIKKVLKT